VPDHSLSDGPLTDGGLAAYGLSPIRRPLSLAFLSVLGKPERNTATTAARP
jgi:hypothetical protein